ncbi:MAG: PLP-dependent transferase [Alistipes sp.]
MLSEPSKAITGCDSRKPSDSWLSSPCRAEGVRDLGCCISPFNSFMIMQGIETLSLRVQREAGNALALARYFKAHPLVEQVFYPGWRTIRTTSWPPAICVTASAAWSVVLKGDKRQTESLVDHLRLVSHLANVGDNRTLIISRRRRPIRSFPSRSSARPAFCRRCAHFGRHRTYRRPDPRFRASLFLRESLTDGKCLYATTNTTSLSHSRTGSGSRAADRLSYLRQVQGQQRDLGLPRADGQLGRGRLVAADRRAGRFSTRAATMSCVRTSSGHTTVRRGR